MEKAIRRAKKEGKIAKTAQQTIPYEEMYPDGICRITNRLYSKSVLCDDINYAEASDDEKAVLFELYCKLVNYFGPSVGFELSVICYPADLVEYRKMLALNPQGDQFDEIRKEYSDMLVRQVSKSRYERRICLTYTIEADGIRQARSRLEQIDNDVVGHFLDPENEYTSLCQQLSGQVIRLAPDSHDYINPLDVDLTTNTGENPLLMKADFIMSFCELILSAAQGGLKPIEKSVIDRCIPKIYRQLIKDPRPENMPILGDLYECLRAQQEEQAQELATALELYVFGSLNYLNHRTNVNVDNRVACYDISGLGQNLKKPGMLTVQNNIWQRTIVNRYAGKTTRIYLDEFHLLLKEPQTAAYTAEIYKRFRKWNGIPTSLTQNVKDLLESPEIENILENSDFILMLNQAASDRNILAQRLGISPQELGHITNSDAGEGLLFFGDKIIPFVDKFPTDTKLYQVMTTKPADLAA